MRINLNLTLTKKGFILVALPLVFELAFLFTMARYLAQAEEQASQLAKSRETIAQINQVEQLMYRSLDDLTNYETSLDPALRVRYEKDTVDLHNLVVKIFQIVQQYPEERQCAERLVRAQILHEGLLKAIKDALDRGDRFEAIKLASSRHRRVGIDNIAKEAQELVRLEKEHTIDPGEEPQTRAQMQKLLWLGLILNILIAIALAVYFNKGTAKRLHVLMDNSQRLTRKQSLNPPLTGGDEIADLDRVFHDMAVTLAEAARKERAVIDNAADVICSIDAEGKFTAINPASAKNWSYEPDELIGKSCFEILVPEDVENTRRAIAEAVAGHATTEFENRLRRKDDSVVDMLWSVQWSDRESALFCVVHDISDRKEMDRMKQEFVAMVSHDLRTPLSSVLGALQLIERGIYGALNERGLQILTRTDSSVRRLIKLVNDILDVEKLEAGKLEILPNDVPIARIVQKSLDSVRTVADQNQIALDADEPDAQIYADEDRLVQVLVNLLSNAIKFSPQGETVKISISSNDGWTEVRVTDRGCGIPPEHRDAIFERFRQVKASDSKEKGGTGLGLAICRAIIEQHGGSIGVDSEVGKGSSFWVRLPAGVPAAPANDLPTGSSGLH